MCVLSHTEVTAQGHKASNWKTWDSSPGSLASQPAHVATSSLAILSDTPGSITDLPTDMKKPLHRSRCTSLVPRHIIRHGVPATHRLSHSSEPLAFWWAGPMWWVCSLWGGFQIPPVLHLLQWMLGSEPPLLWGAQHLGRKPDLLSPLGAKPSFSLAWNLRIPGLFLSFCPLLVQDAAHGWWASLCLTKCGFFKKIYLFCCR